MNNEIESIRDRYERRKRINEIDLYNPLNPAVYLNLQEKERALINWIHSSKLTPIENKRILEIGCGYGGNLLQFIKLGFKPENIVGNELLEERAQFARSRLPKSTNIIVGDASSLQLKYGSFDIVFQSTVFTSILDTDFQKKLADRMWDLVKPGGGVLWYDFIYDNPKNPDVKGVPVSQISELFPRGKLTVWHITLAPPIARRVTKIHPCLYSILNIIPLFRTHVLCWIEKENRV